MRAAVTRLSAGLVWVLGHAAVSVRNAVRPGRGAAALCMRAAAWVWGHLGMPCTQWLGFGAWDFPGRDPREVVQRCVGCYTLQLVATADRGVLAALGRASEGRRGGDALAWACNSAGTGLGFFQRPMGLCRRELWCDGSSTKR